MSRDSESQLGNCHGPQFRPACQGQTGGTARPPPPSQVHSSAIPASGQWAPPPPVPMAPHRRPGGQRGGADPASAKGRGRARASAGGGPRRRCTPPATGWSRPVWTKGWCHLWAMGGNPTEGEAVRGLITGVCDAARQSQSSTGLRGWFCVLIYGCGSESPAVFSPVCMPRLLWLLLHRWSKQAYGISALPHNELIHPSSRRREDQRTCQGTSSLQRPDSLWLTPATLPPPPTGTLTTAARVVRAPVAWRWPVGQQILYPPPRVTSFPTFHKPVSHFWKTSQSYPSWGGSASLECKRH